MRSLALISILISAPVVCGQEISINAGVNAGVPLVKSVENPTPRFDPSFVVATATVERPRYVSGPTLELNLGGEFSIEADVLYRPVGFQTHEVLANFIGTTSVTAYSIEVPVLGQFTFGSGRFRPIAGVGFVVYDKLWGANDFHGSIPSMNLQTHVRTPYRPDDSSSAPPLVLTAGFSLVRSQFTLIPQLRYTRWAGNNVRIQNQWDILLGFTLPVFHHRY